ncbi:MAG: UDP-N-acetylmuramate dehydrogenase [Clostridia bacterium]|nr:UDP-N-acetylmuramate dehydrogenase [Clostridia bacterium]
MNRKFIDTVNEICKTSENVPLSEKSSFRIGGAAKLCAFPSNEDEVCRTVALCKESGVKYAVLGNMTNVLAGDDGYDGVVIFTTALSDHEFQGTEVKARCGASVTALASSAAKKNLGGLEFAYGIPGSLGGAIFMNAGAYGGEMKEVVKSVRAYDVERGEVREYSADECGFDYRMSRFRNSRDVILSAVLKLKEGDAEKIAETMAKNMLLRKEKQPLDKPSAGSTFKRPQGAFAGELIERAGLKGYTVGGAQVSEKHAGFVVNTGCASEKDVKELISHIKSRVLQTSGILLEEEIIYLD